MARKYEKPETFNVRGEVLFAFLNKPSTKFKPEGEFNLVLRVPAEVGKPLYDQWRAKAKEVLTAKIAEIKAGDDAKQLATLRKVEAKMKEDGTRWGLTTPIAAETDEKTGEATGAYILRLKRKASGTDSKTGKTWNARVPLFDCSKPPKEIQANPAAGTIGVANFHTTPYLSLGLGKAGLSSSLRGFQIIKYVPWSGGESAQDMGFEGAEDGFVGEAPSESAAPAGVGAEGGTSDTGADFE